MVKEFQPYPFKAKQYSARLPTPEQTAKRAKVVIVGGGPVGLSVALGLARQGVASVLIEADDGVCFGSRAICISRRSLEIIDRLGALDGFLQTGLAWTGGRSFYRNEEVLAFKMPQDDNQKLPPMVNLAQYSIEQFLLDAAERVPDLIDIHWQTRMTAIDARPDGVTLSLSNPLGEYQLEADWVVAGDGGRSTIRELLDAKLVGTSYEGRYVIVDILMESDRPTERLAFFDPPANPGSTVLVHKQPDNVWRIDYQLRDDEDPEEAIKMENVAPRVQSMLDMMGERNPWAPIWTGIYKANALTLENYRHGRVLFAGDAAHLVPIFGVRGANSGIDDADNLAWKLAYVVQGKASDSLLDTYSDERVFATHENLSYGTKSTEFMAPPSFAFQLMRTAVLSLAVKHPALSQLINPRQTSAITYTESPLNQEQEENAAFNGGPRTGAVLPEGRLKVQGKDAHVTDLLGVGFTLYFFGDGAAIPSAWEQAAQRLARKDQELRLVTVTREQPEASSTAAWDSDGSVFALYDAAPGSAYLVRPDGHVLARWKKAQPERMEAAILKALNV